MYSANAKPRSVCHRHEIFRLFHTLPQELLSEIAAYLPVNDVLSFCLVCKEFNPLGLDILYKTIQNVKPSCLDALASNYCAARAVKTFALPTQIYIEVDRVCTWLRPDDIAHDPNIEEPAIDVRAAFILPSLSNLRNLSVPSFSTIYNQPLSQCHFPNIQVLSYAMPITQAIKSFLTHNTTLVSLTFNSYLPFRHNFVPGSISLPQLRYLSGAPQVIKVFAEHAPLETAHVDWKYERTKIEVLDEALNYLSRYCSTTLKVLAIHRSTFKQRICNTQILVAISKKLPRITKLGLNDINLTIRSTVTVNNAFSRFAYLESLNMDQHPPSAVCPPRLLGSAEPNYDRDEAMILSWASENCCPTLRECRLPNGILWTLQGQKNWLPSLSTVPRRKSLIYNASRWCKRRSGLS